VNEDLSNLISELRGQVLYLQELGVDSLDAELPNFQFAESLEIHKKSQIQHPKSEYIIPDEDILKSVSTSPPITPKVDKPIVRDSQINTGSLLSRLPKLSDVSAPKEFNKPIEKSPIEPMPTKPIEPNPTDTLFGDISQTLPESNETLAEIHAEIGPKCTRCTLCEQRKQVVNSTGNPQAKLMFIGEAPGADEDAQGFPFVGRAGQLLNKIVEAIGMKREEVFIGNVNRCRPPQNRQPLPPEVAACKPFLLREITIVRPQVIVVLGNTACQNLLDTKVGITKLRGNFQDYFGVKVMPTFHPAYLLRDPSKKRETWEDMKKVRDYLNSLG
jgi:DNA polymerase